MRQEIVSKLKNIMENFVYNIIDFHPTCERFCEHIFLQMIRNFKEVFSFSLRTIKCIDKKKVKGSEKAVRLQFSLG